MHENIVAHKHWIDVKKEKAARQIWDKRLKKKWIFLSVFDVSKSHDEREKRLSDSVHKMSRRDNLRETFSGRNSRARAQIVLLRVIHFDFEKKRSFARGISLS